MKTKEVYKGAIYLRIKVIDWTPINKIISERVGQEVECRIGNGLIEDVQAIFDKESEQVEVKSLIIDKECCGLDSDTRNFYVSDLNDGKPFTVNLFKGIGFFKIDKETENGFSVSMFPSYYFDIDMDDIKKCLTGEEKPLYQFMKGRYGYNPRIMSNEMGILKLVYLNKLKEGDKDWLEKELMEIED